MSPGDVSGACFRRRFSNESEVEIGTCDCAEHDQIFYCPLLSSSLIFAISIRARSAITTPTTFPSISATHHSSSTRSTLRTSSHSEQSPVRLELARASPPPDPCREERSPSTYGQRPSDAATQPLLSAFFKSPLPAQCAQTQHYVLLVPTTETLLTHHEAETNATAHEILLSEEFIASHVLRIPSGNAANGAAAPEPLPNLRDMRGKAKQYNTINGRNVVIKDGFVYSNKADEFNLLSPAESSDRPAIGRKKDIRYFHDLLNHFPIIARHMQPGLERLFRDFTSAFQHPLPPPPSAQTIPDPDSEAADAVGPVIGPPEVNGVDHAAAGNSLVNSDYTSEESLPVTEDFYAEDDEDVMRATLRAQSPPGSTFSKLTGSIVEKLLERYVAENVHHLLFPKLCALKRPYDLELEAKIRIMENIDVSQLGVEIQNGIKGKHDLIIQLGVAIEEFKKMTGAMCPQEMLSLLVTTVKNVTSAAEGRPCQGQPGSDAASEKPLMMVNADTLVSLLLFVVIRAQVKNLKARFTYIRQFIFIDDIDTGEKGYALSTFEAVLAYLALDSSGLRRASKRNKALWNAAAKGNLGELKRIMEPSGDALEDMSDSESEIFDAGPNRPLSFSSSRRSSRRPSVTELFSSGSGLGHVFPFEASIHDEGGPAVHFHHPTQTPAKKMKKVSMDTRSMSSSSEISFRSRATSFGTINSALEADISVERLSQTHDAFGESVVMMAVQNEQVEVLHYLLSLPQLYPLSMILEDINNEDTTLLSAAVQMGNRRIIDCLMGIVFASATPQQIALYLTKQDIWGRSLGHYLFHAPYLIAKIGNVVPWRQRDKNGQTPLFALCRSYDQEKYAAMVAAGIDAARRAQGDGERLHLDDHVDNKGNTLLHIVTDAMMLHRILERCDVEVNATNDRKFTPLMLASKYGRYDLVRMLMADPRVDVAARELRGLTAVELAKDDDVRNKFDDLMLFSMPAGPDWRITGVVRAFFVEDGSVRLVLKSAAPTPEGSSYTVTTCRRSLTDFEALVDLLSVENPSSWIPPVAVARSPFQIPGKPSRSMLREIQTATDWFMKIMLAHPTFAAHETLWEFFLMPEIRLDTMTQRSKLKAEALLEKIRDEMEPVGDVREVEQFVDHAREMVRSVSHSARSVMRRTSRLSNVITDLYDATKLWRRAVNTLEFLPQPYKLAIDIYTQSLEPRQNNPHDTLHATLQAQQGTILALLSALARPPALVAQIRVAQKTLERTMSAAASAARTASSSSSSTGGGSKSPWAAAIGLGGLLEDPRKQQRQGAEREEKVRRAREEVDDLGRELRYGQQVVAGELAGWQDMRAGMGRRRCATLRGAWWCRRG
ncbi:unnamed protein product [Parascedosporium putredinis]|uniref:VPS9 domain-containing protein n=1 Tax=Parascedosporium putredinis TaxID=1442378 RepID=A0A9P1GX11_9PEZI|nr:unnamed protein product [Parascedosporium putredinis]CAI7989377.1 unnamed protein product [Parascedosporium putredinis]